MATTADNFNAAASPIINAKKEKIPKISPFAIPLKIAKSRMIKKTTSIDKAPDLISKLGGYIVYFPAKISFTIAAIVFPSAFPASCLFAIPITLPISAGDEAPVSFIIF